MLEPAPGEGARERGALERFRLLLVEDHRGDARFVRELLAKGSDAVWDVVWVTRLGQCAERLRAQPFDVVLLDLSLPDADGIQGVSTLCAEFPEVPVVVLTGVDDLGLGLMAVQAGAQDYLAKPRVDADWLARSLRYAMERRRLERARQDGEKLCSEIVQHSLGLLCMHDLAGQLLSVNPAAGQSLGLSPDELRGRSLAEVLHPEVRPQFREYLERIRLRGRDRGYMRVVAKDGRERIWSYRNVRVEPSGGAPYVIGSALDVTEQLAYQNAGEEHGLRDALTGCFNRWFLERFEAQYAESGWGCLYLDVDHFKAYNDAHGPQAGDELLVQMGRFLGMFVRPRDRVVRLGGDEFLVLLPGADAATAEAVADRLREEAPTRAPASFSVGWAARTPAERLSDTIDRADHALLSVRVAARYFETKRRPPPPR
jgi:diguanylate cyclase (GGDEF)-like protein/PAS domain S-box-containing protein